MDLNSSFASRMVREELAEIKRKEKKSAGCASKIHDKGHKDVIFGNIVPVRSFWVRLTYGQDK